MILQKARSFFKLIRPELPAAAGVCVVLGQAIGLGQIPPLLSTVLGFLLGFFLSASAMIFNDYFDLAVDRVNAPERPLPSGQISPAEAVTAGILTAVAALGIAASLHPAAFGLSLAAWAFGFLYNWRLKAAGIWGNLIVSANVALTFLIGGVSAGRIGSPMVWAFALIAGFFDLAEEIAADAMDAEGDKMRGSKSLAIVYGKRTALTVSRLLFGVVILLTFVPMLLGETSPAYVGPILVMDALILLFAPRLAASQTREEGHAWLRRLYLSATLGLAAFLLARFI